MEEKNIYTLCRACKATLKGNKFIGKDLRYNPLNQYEYIKCMNCGSDNIFFDEKIDESKFYYRDYETHTVELNSTGKISMIRESLRSLSVRIWSKKSNKNFQYTNILKTFLGPYVNWCSFPKKNNAKYMLLDVGAGAGTFASKMEQLGWAVSLVEPDTNAKSWTVEVSGKKYLKINEIECQNIKYDAIVFNHTIEHMINAREQITKALELLKKDGEIVIVTPNGWSLFYQIYKNTHWHLDAPRHLCIYNPRSILKLIKESDLKTKIYFTSRANKTCMIKTLQINRQLMEKKIEKNNILINILGQLYSILGFLSQAWTGFLSEELILIIRKK